MWKKQMAEEERLRGMVAKFPVSHLRKLLAYACQNTSGDETQLRTRAMELVRRRSPYISVRIKALNASLSPPPLLHAPEARPPPPLHAPAARPLLRPPSPLLRPPSPLLRPPSPLHAPAARPPPPQHAPAARPLLRPPSPLHAPAARPPPPQHAPEARPPPPLHAPAARPPPPLLAPAARPPPPLHAPAARPPPLLHAAAARPPPLLHAAAARPPPLLHAAAARPPPPLHAIGHHRLMKARSWRRPPPMVLCHYSPSGAENMMVPDHPAIRMTDLIFFDHVDVLLKMTILVHQNSNPRQTQKLSFRMRQQQLAEVADSMLRRDGIFQAQVRICNLDREGIQDDAFPPRLVVAVNGNIVRLKTASPTRTDSPPKSIPGPIDITHFVKVTSSDVNDVLMSWDAGHRGRYAVGINLVRHLQVSELVERLRDRGVTSPVNTVTRVRRLLDGDNLEIAPMSHMLTVSLCCPVSRALMEVPCRGARCNHVQCFDAGTYLKLNEKRPTWRCPVCDELAHYYSLEVDGYFTSVLADPSRRDCQEIQLDRDGSWSPVFRRETVAVTLPADGDCEIVTSSSSEDDDDDDEDDDDDDDIIVLNGDVSD